MIGLRAGVGKARVAHDDRGAVLLSFDDALRVRVEVVARFEVGGDQEDDLGVGIVGRRTVVTHPTLIANASVRAADVGVAVVAVHSPRLEHAVGIALFTRTTNVIHDLVVAFFLHCLAQATAQFGERLIPADAFPTARPSLADALHREHDPLGVIDLVQGRRTLRTIAATAGWMLGVTFDFFDLAGVLVEPRG